MEHSGRTAQQTAEAIPGETGGVLAASDSAESGLRGWQTGSELNSCTDEWKRLLDNLSREMDSQGDKLIRTAVTRDDTARRVGATMPDGARIFVTIEPHGNTHLDATVDPVKDPGTFTLFNDEQTPRPSSAATPAGRQDDPYWSH
ncbi:hypothetical protein ACFYST_30085 [Kitasatospora sp. NPDC004614]|uniref:hypothetical protein n=1 Tax=unclassified Kitasatospora TaxID=2633591 RepID=UPI0036C17906